MAVINSQGNLQEQLKKAQQTKQGITQQIEIAKKSVSIGFFVCLGVGLVFSLFVVGQMEGAPADKKNLMFWISFLIMGLGTFLYIGISSIVKRNTLEEQLNTVCMEIRRIEREFDRIDAQVQLEKGEEELPQLEHRFKKAEDHLNRLQAFCDFFAQIGAADIAPVLAPAVEAVNAAQNALAVQKSQNDALKKICRSY